MNSSVLFLVFYTLLWIVTLILKLKSYKKWGASSILYFSLAVYGALSIYLYIDEEIDEEITLFPLLYLYIMFYIAARPIEQYDKKNILGVEPPRNENVLTLITVFYIFIALIQAPTIITNISDGIKIIMLDSVGGAELYSESKQETVSYDGSVSNIFSVVYNILSPLLFLLLFYYLSKEKIRKKLVIGLLFCVIIEFLSGIAKGQRTGATMMFMSFIITYFAFKSFLPLRLVRYIRNVGLILGLMILIPFSFITISRFSETEKGVSGALTHYVGQSVVNFDLYAFSANGTRDGDRTCNTFKHILGISGTPKGMMETRQKYSYMKLDDGSFSTLVGDFVLDFGPFLSFFLFMFSSLFFLGATQFKGKYIPFHKMILCYLVMIICMQGGMYLFNFSYKGNLSLIAIFLFYIIFRTDYHTKQVYNAKH